MAVVEVLIRHVDVGAIRRNNRVNFRDKTINILDDALALEHAPSHPLTNASLPAQRRWQAYIEDAVRKSWIRRLVVGLLRLELAAVVHMAVLPVLRGPPPLVLVALPVVALVSENTELRVLIHKERPLNLVALRRYIL